MGLTFLTLIVVLFVSVRGARLQGSSQAEKVQNMLLEAKEANGWEQTPVLMSIDDLPTDWVQIESQNGASTRQCMTVEGNSKEMGANIMQWEATLGSESQEWKLETVDDTPFVKIISKLSGHVVAIGGGSTTAGANILQWIDSDIPNEEFLVVYTGSKPYYAILAKHSLQAVSVAGGTQSNGGNILQWPLTTIKNQQWKFVAPPSHAPAADFSANTHGNSFDNPSADFSANTHGNSFDNPSASLDWSKVRDLKARGTNFAVAGGAAILTIGAIVLFVRRKRARYVAVDTKASVSQTSGV